MQFLLMAHFGAKLGDLIDKRTGMGKGEFAEHAGIGTATLNRMLRANKWQTSSDSFKLAAKALKMTREELAAATLDDGITSATIAVFQAIAAMTYDECDLLTGSLTRRMLQLDPARYAMSRSDPGLAEDLGLGIEESLDAKRSVGKDPPQPPGRKKAG